MKREHHYNHHPKSSCTIKILPEPVSWLLTLHRKLSTKRGNHHHQECIFNQKVADHGFIHAWDREPEPSGACALPRIMNRPSWQKRFNSRRRRSSKYNTRVFVREGKAARCWPRDASERRVVQKESVGAAAKWPHLLCLRIPHRRATDTLDAEHELWSARQQNRMIIHSLSSQGAKNDSRPFLKMLLIDWLTSFPGS